MMPRRAANAPTPVRLAGTVSKLEDNVVRVFLIGDAVSSSHRKQKVPQGFLQRRDDATQCYLESMRHGLMRTLKSVISVCPIQIVR